MVIAPLWSRCTRFVAIEVTFASVMIAEHCFPVKIIPDCQLARLPGEQKRHHGETKRAPALHQRHSATVTLPQRENHTPLTLSSTFCLRVLQYTVPCSRHKQPGVAAFPGIPVPMGCTHSAAANTVNIDPRGVEGPRHSPWPRGKGRGLERGASNRNLVATPAWLQSDARLRREPTRSSSMLMPSVDGHKNEEWKNNRAMSSTSTCFESCLDATGGSCSQAGPASPAVRDRSGSGFVHTEGGDSDSSDDEAAGAGGATSAAAASTERRHSDVCDAMSQARRQMFRLHMHRGRRHLQLSPEVQGAADAGTPPTLRRDRSRPSLHSLRDRSSSLNDVVGKGSAGPAHHKTKTMKIMRAHLRSVSAFRAAGATRAQRSGGEPSHASVPRPGAGTGAGAGSTAGRAAALRRLDDLWNVVTSVQPAADASRDPPAPVQWLREEYHKSLHSSRSGSGRGLVSEARNGQTAPADRAGDQMPSPRAQSLLKHDLTLV